MQPIVSLWEKKDVHGTRVFIKRLRAALSLLHFEEPEIQSIAKTLAPHRDLEVQRKTLRSLKRNMKRKKDEKFRRALELNILKRIRSTQKKRSADLRRARRDLNDRLRVISPLTERLQTPYSVLPELQQSYREARRLWKRGKKNKKLKDLHDWRTQTKELEYQLSLLGVQGVRAEHFLQSLQALGTDLGKLHDLGVLTQAVKKLSKRKKLPWARPSFFAVIEKKIEKKRRKGLKLGQRLFAEKLLQEKIGSPPVFSGSWQGLESPTLAPVAAQHPTLSQMKKFDDNALKKVFHVDVPNGL